MRVTAKRQATKRSSAPKPARSAAVGGTDCGVGVDERAHDLGPEVVAAVAEGQRGDGQVVGETSPGGLLEVDEGGQGAGVVVKDVVDEEIAVDDPCGQVGHPFGRQIRQLRRQYGDRRPPAPGAPRRAMRARRARRSRRARSGPGCGREDPCPRDGAWRARRRPPRRARASPRRAPASAPAPTERLRRSSPPQETNSSPAAVAQRHRRRHAARGRVRDDRRLARGRRPRDLPSLTRRNSGPSTVSTRTFVLIVPTADRPVGAIAVSENAARMPRTSAALSERNCAMGTRCRQRRLDRGQETGVETPPRRRAALQPRPPVGQRLLQPRRHFPRCRSSSSGDRRDREPDAVARAATRRRSDRRPARAPRWRRW